MSKLCLYTSSKGYQVRRHSYSAGADFERCPRLYQLKRIQGWREKTERAALSFGTAIETAIQQMHVEGADIAAAFEKKWLESRDKALDYSEKESDWKTLNEIGKQMSRLYALKAPGWSINSPRFQTQFMKEVFPGSEYAGLEDVAYIDMLLNEPQPTLIDIKTSSVAAPHDPSLLTLDPQLRRYAWTSGIRRIGFLWFQKQGLGFRKGDEVTLLEAIDRFSAGETVKILKGGKEYVWFVYPGNYSEFERLTEGLKGVEAEKTLERFAKEYGASARTSAVSKQKVDLIVTEIADEDAIQAGEDAGQQIVEIVAASQSGTFKQKPGIRFPDNKCLLCSMAPICTRQSPEKIAESLVQIGAATERDWLDELEAE